MIGGVLVGSVLGMLAGAVCLVAGVPVLPALGVWSGTGALAVVLAARLSIRSHPRGVSPVLQPQRG